MPAIKNYFSSDEDEDVTEIFTRKPSERRSKPSFEALRDHHRNFFSTFQSLTSRGQKDSDDNSDDKTTDDKLYVPPNARPIVSMKRCQLPTVSVNRSSSQAKKIMLLDEVAPSKHADAESISDLSEVSDKETIVLDSSLDKDDTSLTAKPNSSNSKEAISISSSDSNEDDDETYPLGFTIFFLEAKKAAQMKYPKASNQELRGQVLKWWQNMDVAGRKDYEEKDNERRASRKPKSASSKPPQPSNDRITRQIRDIQPGRKIVRCLNDMCNNIAIDDPRWNGQFCSTACVVVACSNSLAHWVLSRSNEREECFSPPPSSAAIHSSVRPNHSHPLDASNSSATAVEISAKSIPA